ncbi:nuclear transport factor 2 family protein [Agromyces larvae]|uniref:Nuclear transport factor 2 family protein n=1 Tax=Agromyces larvae TaxID=2929802 RepID=A0ABY4C2T5_9MICO|nr:nuclear transport factor 2 family protein [Agromyces larvae]UOE45785.1 nuclear transport factor 2 family protein [Agromyces larvae]
MTDAVATRDVHALFALIDSGNIAEFGARLAEDVVFRFGNEAPLTGIAGVGAGIGGVLGSIRGIRHAIVDAWQPEPDVSVVRMEVDVERADGEVVRLPNVDVIRWRGDLVAEWHIFMDAAPLGVPIDQVPDAVRVAA